MKCEHCGRQSDDMLAEINVCEDCGRSRLLEYIGDPTQAHLWASTLDQSGIDVAAILLDYVGLGAPGEFEHEESCDDPCHKH